MQKQATLEMYRKKLSQKTRNILSPKITLDLQSESCSEQDNI